MPSAFSKLSTTCLVAGLVMACTVGDPNDSPGDGGSGTGGSQGSGGAAGASGTASTAGTSSSQAGTGGAVAGTSSGGAGAGGGGAGGQGQAGTTSGGAGGMGGGGLGGMGGAAAAAFVLTSPAFDHVEACSQQNHEPCELFPLANVMTTIGGDNASPELIWGPGPAGTLSYVITLHDFSNDFTHWAIWNIPATTLKLEPNLARDQKPAVPAGSQQKSFDNNNAGYGYMGPGAKDHVYEFRLYALKVATFTPQDASSQGKIYDELEADAGKIVLGEAMLRGRSPN
jgi:Raf kinase inhibitor-like YbhB/YbcL family protein